MKVLINIDVASDFERATGIECVPLLPYKNLDTPVASHADMLFCILDKTVFCYEEYVSNTKIEEILKNSGYCVVYIDKKCEKQYPNDVYLNVLVMGKNIFCNKNYVAKEILDYATENGYEVTNVKQGYSACSTLVIDDNNAITSDLGIAKAINSCGKRALLVSNEGIDLPGYNCGFFGGASIVLGKSVYFWGDITLISSYKATYDFISSCGYNIIQFSTKRVCDFGGGKIIF